MSGSYLPPGLPQPRPSADRLDGPYWEGTLEHELRIQRCGSCKAWQWGPEWICHQCLGDSMGYESIEPSGVIYSWERVWHPVHPALGHAVPYLIVLVTLPQAGGVRTLGNLVGDPLQEVEIGAPVEAVFEDHLDGDPPFTLVQWRRDHSAVNPASAE